MTVWVIPKKSVTPDQLARADQVICAYNRTRVGLNKTIRKQLGREGNDPIIGDRIICLQNDN
jgi:exodeoxyribonuclease-5